MIPRRTVVCLGLSQLACCGVSYYLIGVFGELIAADLGWTLTVVYGSFTAALVMMGFTSPFISRRIDARGGRRVMTHRLGADRRVLRAALGVALGRRLLLRMAVHGR